MIPGFDFREPDYALVLRRRFELLRKIRDPEKGPETLAILRAHYKLAPWQFIEDWGVTYDPRNIERGLPAHIPFVPFPKQIELMQWILGKWRGSEEGLIEKSRDTGASWCAIALSCTLCLFHPGMSIGFGSRKEEYVDRLDAPKALFPKARTFMQNLPIEFRGGWSSKANGAFMRLTFPEAGSVMTGEAGDNIGRGDRTSIYFVDESAHLERPNLAEAALSATTNCRIDMSSVNGMDNPFAKKRHSWHPSKVFTFHWRDDPRKDEAWYQRQRASKDAAVIAQELDIDYAASVRGVVIPQAWVQAAIGAAEKLGITISGARTGALDVADQGPDLNAFAGRYGIELEYVESWDGGNGSDIFKTAERAHAVCDDQRFSSYRYDADGLGAGVRGDARVINERDPARAVEVEAYRGSESPVNGEGIIESVDNVQTSEDREQIKNKDFFRNRKAQSWWSLRLRFERTYRAVVGGEPVTDPDLLISLNPRIPKLTELCLELSQATYSENGAGKLLIDKAPDGQKSPNLADAVVIAYAPSERKAAGFFDF